MPSQPQHLAFARRTASALRPVLSVLAAAALLVACGGGKGVADPVAGATAGPAGAASAATATTLSGSVATGAPLTDAKLRIVDATGAVIAQDVAVDAEGRYAAVTLTGTAPWRLQACGYAGSIYQCIYSVAQAGGTANVTPLTSAMLLLASGQQPEALMTGTASALTASALATAQTTLLGALAPVLSDAGLSTSLNLVSGALQAGSRTGYDRVLDAVGVATGVDTQPFVQISPRLGSGNLYIEQGSAPLGQLASTTGAAQLSLQGLEQLFRNMTLAARTSATCTAPADGMATLMASNASMSMGGSAAMTGPAAVGAGLCELLAGGNGEPARLGSRFLSPTLGRCDLSGAVPVCGISFVLQDAEGHVEQVGGGMGVTFESGAWKFKGELLPIGIEASARVQRNRRIDGTQSVTSYARALAFDIPAVAGLACAKVAQRNADGAAVTLALFKPHLGDGPAQRLSAWRDEQSGASRSLNPAVGNTRNGDDTWLELPEGTEGDTAVRNFLRGGRNVTVSLYSDSNCSAPFDVAGRSSFEVEVQGVPPVWSQLPNLPWPTLTDAAAAALSTFTVPAGGNAPYSAAWTVARGSLGVDEMIFCSDRAGCGQDQIGRVGEVRLRGAATGGTVNVKMPGGQALEANGYKMLAIYGRTADGAGLQSSYMSCSSRPAGVACEGN